MAARVVLVEPKYDGNVGSVARAMKNFGLSELVLVNPCPLGEDARRRAMHGIDILEGARTMGSLAVAVKGCGLVAGTTAVDTRSEKRFARISSTPREFAERVRGFGGRMALVFGREDDGLHDEEIKGCDALITIPASREYPVLNLSHAAAILFYELHQAPSARRRVASDMERGKLHDAFSDLVRATDYPRHKVERTQVMFRRLIGRAMPTKWEFHALIGVYTRATKRIRRLDPTVVPQDGDVRSARRRTPRRRRAGPPAAGR